MTSNHLSYQLQITIHLNSFSATKYFWKKVTKGKCLVNKLLNLNWGGLEPLIIHVQLLVIFMAKQKSPSQLFDWFRIYYEKYCSRKCTLLPLPLGEVIFKIWPKRQGFKHRRSQDFWLGAQTTCNDVIKNFRKRNYLWDRDIAEWKIRSPGRVSHLTRILLKGEGLKGHSHQVFHSWPKCWHVPKMHFHRIWSFCTLPFSRYCSLKLAVFHLLKFCHFISIVTED